MAHITARHVAVIAMVSVVALVGACEATVPPVTPTPAPASNGPTVAPSPPVSPTTTPSATVSAAPTASAAPSATPGPTTSPTAAATASPVTSAWQYLDDFPAGDAIEVAAVTHTTGGYIAVGSEPAEGQGFFGVRQGVVWTADDGAAWRRSTPEAFVDSTLLHVVEMAQTPYIFGVRSVCDLADDECDDLPDAGVTVWTDDGTGWQRLPQSPVLKDAFLAGVVAMDDTLVAYGDSGQSLQATAWTSTDGVTWEASTELAGMDPISAAAAGPDGLVAFGTRLLRGSGRIATVAAYSVDGRNFEPVDLPSGLELVIDSVAWGAAGFVAVGADEEAQATGGKPAVLASLDGRSWEEVPLDDAFAATSLRQVRATPAGYLLIGSRPSRGDPQRDTGLSWQSADGRKWVGEALFGGGHYRLYSGSAVGPTGAVAVALDYQDEPATGPLSTIRIWFAPMLRLIPR